jgi:hypothetical protein
MTPTSFEFSVSMPRDARLVGAVRGLAAHAAGYVQLAADAAEGLADRVAHATEAAMAATASDPGPIDFRFAGDAAAINITITCPAPPASPVPSSTSAAGISVDWTTNGSHHICAITQRIGS